MTIPDAGACDSQPSELARSRRRWFQDLFVTAEVAAAFVLVVMTMLLLRSLLAVQQVQPGFDPQHVTTAFFLKPANDQASSAGSRLSCAPARVSARLRWLIQYPISPDYLQTLRIPWLRGGSLADSDTGGSPLVCLIDARLAERFFPNEDPLGQEIAMYRGWARIVGVVGAIRDTTLEDNSRPAVYYSLAQVPFFPQAAIVGPLQRAGRRYPS